MDVPSPPESLVPNDLLCFLHSYTTVFSSDNLKHCILSTFSYEAIVKALAALNTVLHDNIKTEETSGDDEKKTEKVLDQLLQAYKRVEVLRDSGTPVPVFVSRDLRRIPFEISMTPSLSGNVLNRILEELQSLKTLIVASVKRPPASSEEQTHAADLSLTVNCDTDNNAPTLNNSGNSGTSSEISPTKLAMASPESPREGLLGIKCAGGAASVRRRGITANLESTVERIKQRKVSPTTERKSLQVHAAAKCLVPQFLGKPPVEPNNNINNTPVKSSPVKNSLPTGSLPNFTTHVNNPNSTNMTALLNEASMHCGNPELLYQQQWYHAYMSSLQNIQMMMNKNVSPRPTNANMNPLSGLSLLSANHAPNISHPMHSPPGSVWPSYACSNWREGALTNGSGSKISPNNTATATSSLSGGDVPAHSDRASSVNGQSIKEEIEDDSPELDDDMDLDMDDYSQDAFKMNNSKDGDVSGSPGSDTVEGTVDGATPKSGQKFAGNRSSKLLNDANKPHECPYPNCTKRFANKFLWKKHVFIHTGERPYECHHCHKKFNRKDNLLRHKKTHSVVGYGGQGRRRPLGETSSDNGEMALMASSPFSFQPAMAQLLAAAAAATSQAETGPENNNLMGLLRSQPAKLEL